MTNGRLQERETMNLSLAHRSWPKMTDSKDFSRDNPAESVDIPFCGLRQKRSEAGTKAIGPKGIGSGYDWAMIALSRRFQATS